MPDYRPRASQTAWSITSRKHAPELVDARARPDARIAPVGEELIHPPISTATLKVFATLKTGFGDQRVHSLTDSLAIIVRQAHDDLGSDAS